MRVHRVAKGALGIPMPKPLDGEVNRKLQGGLPPEPYRSRNAWGAANPRARSDGTSMACRMECIRSHEGWELV